MLASEDNAIQEAVKTVYQVSEDERQRFIAFGREDAIRRQNGIMKRMDRLQEELSTTRDALTSTQDELSSTQEQLSSTKEELSSTKEQLAEKERIIEQLRAQLSKKV